MGHRSQNVERSARVLRATGARVTAAFLWSTRRTRRAAAGVTTRRLQAKGR